MKKSFIKVIKRKDAEVIKNVKTASDCNPEPVALVGEEKIARHSQRKMIDTVSNWISEYKSRNHKEEIATIRRLFGNESVLSKL